MSEWQPIDTAPKDGTEIDVWVVDSRAKQTSGCRYENVRWSDGGWKWFDRYYNVSGGYVGIDNGVNVIASHWMPLPKPPTLPSNQ